MTNWLLQARLRRNASIEDLDYRHSYGLDKGMIQSPADCQWVK